MAQDMNQQPMNHEHMDHEHMTPMADPPMASMVPGSEHHHQMTPGMLMVKREHFWFMIVGFAIALFKFISDADLGRRWLVRSATYLWPGAIVGLGVLLTLYRE